MRSRLVDDGGMGPNHPGPMGPPGMRPPSRWREDAAPAGPRPIGPGPHRPPPGMVCLRAAKRSSRRILQQESLACLMQGDLVCAVLRPLQGRLKGASKLLASCTSCLLQKFPVVAHLKRFASAAAFRYSVSLFICDRIAAVSAFGRLHEWQTTAACKSCGQRLSRAARCMLHTYAARCIPADICIPPGI